MNVVIINGPSLNLLGQREPVIYGKVSFEEFLETLKAEFAEINFTYYQSNVEGELINKLHEYGFDKGIKGIVLNAAGYSHTSVAIADAVKAIDTPVVSVHISNIFSREKFRHSDIVGANCVGCICGFGLKGYQIAINGLINK